MQILAVFKSENKVERYVAIDETPDQKSKIYLLTEDEMIEKVKQEEFKDIFVDNNNILRVKSNIGQQLAYKLVFKTSVKNGEALNDVITGSFPIFKSKHFDGISHGFVVGSINQIFLQDIRGKDYPFVMCTFLAKAETISAFARMVKIRFGGNLIKFTNYGEYGVLLAQVDDFIAIAETKGVIINPNSAKHTLKLNKAVNNIIGMKPVADEAVINKVYNKLNTVEKNLLG